MIVTPAHAASFREHGYVVLERALDAATISLLRDEADRSVEEEAASLRRADPRFVPVSTLDDRYVVSGRVNKTRAIRALLGELMADLCRATLGPDAFLFSETFVCKMPNNRSGWIWHQDSSYLASVGLGHYPPNLSVWIAIDRMTPENGTLRVMPWSRTGLRHVVPHDLENKPWDSDEVVSFGAHPSLVLPVEAGSIVAFSGLLPHASDPNATPEPRRAYLVQYSSQRIEREGRLEQLAIPLLVGGVFQGLGA